MAEEPQQGRKVFIVVGSTGMGKTTTAKNISLHSRFGGLPCFIQDINGQYPEIKNLATNNNFKDFLNRASKLKKHTVIFDEATAYFKPQQVSEDALNLLASKRHTGNLIILNFHSLRKVPLDILDFANYIVIHKTNDIPEKVESKFDDYRNIFEAWSDIMESEMLTASNGKKYSDSVWIKIAD